MWERHAKLKTTYWTFCIFFNLKQSENYVLLLFFDNSSVMELQNGKKMSVLQIIFHDIISNLYYFHLTKRFRSIDKVAFCEHDLEVKFIASQTLRVRIHKRALMQATIIN